MKLFKIDWNTSNYLTVCKKSAQGWSKMLSTKYV